MNWVVNFIKKDRMAFISHLDLQRMLVRAFRIGGVPIQYTRGFNPHPRMRILLPLPLGIASIYEWMEFETASDVNETNSGETGKIWMNNLNQILPDGIRITDIRPAVAPYNKNVYASHLDRVVYEIILPFMEGAEERIAGFMAREEILIENYNRKRGRMETRDIRPQILALAYDRSWGRQMMLRCVMKAGDFGSLNPLMALSGFAEYVGQVAPHEADGFSAEKVSVMRTDFVFDFTGTAYSAGENPYRR